MRLLSNTIVGFTFLTLASCSDSPQQALESTTETKHVAQPNGQSTVDVQSNAHSQHADGHIAANHGSDSAKAASDEVSHQSARVHAATEHAAKRGHHGQHTKTIKVGDKVPDFEVTLDGRTWTLSELRQNKDMTPNGTLVLTFWCSFCHSCRDVERDLDKLAREYHGKAGVIAIDASFGETRQAVTAFAKKRGLTMPIALNTSGSAADILGVKSTTTTVVIDSTGTLRYLGQFRDRRHAFAREALKAVLAGTEIGIKVTRPKG
jgi:thiol-disulfide isomerase/thioredoxin